MALLEGGESHWVQMDTTGPFAIDDTSGEITLIDSLDHEQYNMYKLDVVVSDGELSTSADVCIHVGDVNEAPVLQNVDNQYSVEGETRPLHSVEGDAIQPLRIEASDDDDPRGAGLTYSASGLPAGLSIETYGETRTSAGGESTYTAYIAVIHGTIPYDAAETNGGTYNVEVTVTDSTGLQDTTSFAWTVTNAAIGTLTGTEQENGADTTNSITVAGTSSDTIYITPGNDVALTLTPAVDAALPASTQILFYAESVAGSTYGLNNFTDPVVTPLPGAISVIYVGIDLNGDGILNEETEVTHSFRVAVMVLIDVTVDLDIDSDNNGTIDGTPEEDAMEEDSPGKVIYVIDDTPELPPLDPTDEYDPSQFVVEDHVVPVQLSLSAPADADLEGYRIEIYATGASVMFWDSPEKNNPADLSYTLGPGSPSSYFPSTIYVEALAEGDVTMRMRLLNQAGIDIHDDRLQITPVRNCDPDFTVKPTYKLPAATVLAEDDLDDRVALVRQLIEQQFGASDYDGVAYSNSITASDVNDAATAGKSGFIIGWKIQALEIRRLGFDFRQVKVAFMPYYWVLSSEFAYQVQMKSGVRIAGPTNIEQHEQWHIDGVPQTPFKNAAQSHGIAFHFSGKMPGSPTENDVVNRTGYLREFRWRMFKCKTEMRRAKFVATAAQPVLTDEIATQRAQELVEQWLTGIGAQFAIFDAGTWHGALQFDVSAPGHRYYDYGGIAGSGP